MDGLLIGTVCLNPKYSCIEHSIATFNKSVLNPVFQSLQTLISQHDLLAEIPVAGLICLQHLLKIVYKTYDIKVHQAAITTLNTLVQVIFKKLEQHVQYGVALKTKHVPTSVALETLLVCIELFPNSFKQVVASKQTGAKKDSCTSILEMCLHHLNNA